MAKDVAGCIALMKNLCVPLMWALDPLIVPLPFKDAPLADSKRKLRVGYYMHDGIFQPTPSCSRAVHLTVDKLREAGEWAPSAVISPDPYIH
jgi:hypothetical protein